MTKKVAIVGCSQSKSLTPFNDPEFEIWGVNNLYPHIPRATRWFEIHYISQENGKFLRRESPEFRGQPVDQYLAQLGEWAQKNNCPVYMQQPCSLVPTATVYPLEAMLQMFGGYFTNTVSYMLALAISEGFEEIHVYGVDMAVDTEYHHQRPSCEYFLGVAAGRGIKIHVPAEADLLKTRFLYGFQEPKQLAWDKKLKMMRSTIAEKEARVQKDIDVHTQQINLLKNQLQQYAGAKHALTETDKIWS